MYACKLCYCGVPCVKYMSLMTQIPACIFEVSHARERKDKEIEGLTPFTPHFQQTMFIYVRN